LIGTDEPLVTVEVWQRVQDLLDARADNKTRKVKHDFAFTGLVRRGRRKSGKMHRAIRAPRSPHQPVRHYPAGVGHSQPILEWLGDVVLTSDQTAEAARAQAIKKLQARNDQIQARIETMYMDKRGGRITQEFFARHSAEWNREQNGLR